MPFACVRQFRLAIEVTGAHAVDTATLDGSQRYAAGQLYYRLKLQFFVLVVIIVAGHVKLYHDCFSPRKNFLSVPP